MAKSNRSTPHIFGQQNLSDLKSSNFVDFEECPAIKKAFNTTPAIKLGCHEEIDVAKSQRSLDEIVPALKEDSTPDSKDRDFLWSGK